MILKVEHVGKNFGNKRVLDDINFSVAAGECVGIVGLSGSGKSTLAKIIARLLSSDGGQIILNSDGAFYRNVQMIFQTPEDSFNPRRTLGQSIAEPLENYGINARVEDLLREVGLPAEYAERYPREVSGGECQRAAIARAIGVAPKILICDEATSALDVTIQAQIVALIKKLCAEKNIACLFITHDLALLPRLADRVIVLHLGKIVEEGAPEQLIHAAKSPFTRQLMASNFFTEEVF